MHHAPEMHGEACSPSPAVDVYAFGVLALQLCCACSGLLLQQHEDVSATAGSSLLVGTTPTSSLPDLLQPPSPAQEPRKAPAQSAAVLDAVASSSKDASQVDVLGCVAQVQQLLQALPAACPALLVQLIEACVQREPGLRPSAKHVMDTVQELSEPQPSSMVSIDVPSQPCSWAVAWLD